MLRLGIHLSGVRLSSVRLVVVHLLGVGMLAAVGSSFTHAHVAVERLVTVAYVVDGDTVELASGERVRLIGIDTPERANAKKNTAAEPFADAATQKLIDLVENRQVKLREGRQPRDYYRRLLASLFLTDGTNVQEVLLRQGYGMAVSYPPNVSRLATYAEAEAQARRAGLGIWGLPRFAIHAVSPDHRPKNGLYRVSGTVTSVSESRQNIRMVIGEALTLLIYRDVWREFWRDKNADHWIGREIMARGRIKTYRGAKQMRIMHPFMLYAAAAQ